MSAPPSSSSRACATCGRPVDPLRAPIVAILDGGFAYFCSRACRQASPAVSLVPPRVATMPSAPASAQSAQIVQIAQSAQMEEATKRDEPAPAAPPASATSTSASTSASASTAESATSVRSVAPPIATPRAAPLVDRVGALSVEVDEPAPDSLGGVPPSFLRRAEERARADEGIPRILRTGAFLVATLGVVLGLVEGNEGALRLALASIAVVLGALHVVVARVRWGRGGPLERAVRANLGAPLGGATVASSAAIALAWWLRLGGRAGATTAVNASLWVVLAAAAAEVVAHAGVRATLADARAVLGALEPALDPAPDPAPDPTLGGRAPEPRLGDVVELRVGQLVLEDLRLVSGAIVFDLWGNPALRARRTEGEPVPAGAVIRSGSAAARVVALGRERAFARLLTDALERSDASSSRLRILDRLPAIVAAVVLAIALAVGTFGGSGRIVALVAGVAGAASVLASPARRLAVRDQLAGIVHACRSGAAIRDAEAFTRASLVRTVVICVRGTIVAPAPDTIDVEPLGAASTEDVLALAAGAELAAQHPIATAIQRAAQARGARSIDVRNAVYEPGFGVRGQLANGAEVLVGSRALALRGHVPTAEHEARFAELEATGRDVIVVARDGRAIGLLALQSPLRRGAMASMQRLHDIEVEPVLLGGATRARLEAIGKALDVDHVRPEILARDRGAEVRRIAQSAGPVAVIGRGALDGPALAAADVAIAIGEAGGAPDRPAIALAHEQLVAAIDVLGLAQATRARVSATLSVGLVPVVVAALPVAFGLIRPTYAPLAALAATLALGVRDLVAAALPEGARIEDNPSE